MCIQQYLLPHNTTVSQSVFGAGHSPFSRGFAVANHLTRPDMLLELAVRVQLSGCQRLPLTPLSGSAASTVLQYCI